MLTTEESEEIWSDESTLRTVCDSSSGDINPSSIMYRVIMGIEADKLPTVTFDKFTTDSNICTITGYGLYETSGEDDEFHPDF